MGLAIAAVGGLLWAGVPLGRLPGDIVVRKGAFTFYAPIVTSILASIVITAIIAWLKR